MCNIIEHATRTPWESDFPDVITLCSVDQRDNYDSYKRAKYAKNYNQAMELMYEISHHGKGFKKTINSLNDLADGRDLVIVPVHSLEQSYDPLKRNPVIGSNPLPLAISLTLSDHIKGFSVNTNIVQKNIVGHTGADTLARFAYPALFEGEIEKDLNYLLVDDHISQGGTIANLRGHITSQGGNVVGVTSLTANRGSMCLRQTPRSYNRLTNAENFSSIGCHSHLSETVFGYALNCFTNSETSQIFYQMEAGRKKKRDYNFQNFMTEVITCRKVNDTHSSLTQNKNCICQQKLDGTFIPKHIKPGDKIKAGLL